MRDILVELIQVCRTLDDPKTRDREIRALLKAGEELRCQNLLVLTTDQDESQIVEWFGLKGEVRFLPLWKWLLAVKERTL